MWLSNLRTLCSSFFFIVLSSHVFFSICRSFPFIDIYINSVLSLFVYFYQICSFEEQRNMFSWDIIRFVHMIYWIIGIYIIFSFNRNPMKCSLIQNELFLYISFVHEYLVVSRNVVDESLKNNNNIFNMNKVIMFLYSYISAHLFKFFISPYSSFTQKNVYLLKTLLLIFINHLQITNWFRLIFTQYTTLITCYNNMVSVWCEYFTYAFLSHSFAFGYSVRIRWWYLFHRLTKTSQQWNSDWVIMFQQ